MQNYAISASLLSADFARLGEDAQKVLTAGADMLHLDVMDNHYVPNLTVGPLVCQSLRNYGIDKPIDVHLMVKPVDSLITAFAKAGATYITFHPDATDNIQASIDLAKTHGCKPGLALNPETPLSAIESYITEIDLILIMSVNPGFAGQSFIPSALDKLKNCRELIASTGKNIRLSIDGGIKVANISEVAKAGADTFVSGSGIFGHADYKKMIDDMRHELKKVSL